MKQIKIGTSPLTNTIYAGTTKVDRKTKSVLWNDDKQDVTMDCLLAVVEHCISFGQTLQIMKADGTVEFEIDVKDLRNKN